MEKENGTVLEASEFEKGADTLKGGHHTLASLIGRWERESAAYAAQVEEARAKGLPHDCMLGTMTTLRQCAKDLRGALV